MQTTCDAPLAKVNISSLPASFKTNFYQNGYLFVSDLVPKTLLYDLRNGVIANWLNHRRLIYPPYENPANPNWDAIHEELLQYRTQDPQGFGIFYDTMQTSTALQRLVLSDPVAQAAAMLLGETVDTLTSTGYMLRMDCPNDSKNALGWHQDSAYYSVNEHGDHGLIVTIPLDDVHLNDGPMRIAQGSHSAGRCVSKEAGGDLKQSSTQHLINDQLPSTFEQIDTIVQFGDAVFMHMDTIHKSGCNTGHRIRFTAGVRFHKMLADDYIPGRVWYRPSDGVTAWRERRRGVDPNIVTPQNRQYLNKMSLPQHQSVPEQDPVELGVEERL